MHMNMDEMMKKLENSSGEKFDKNFLEVMIDHHQGGLEMAEMAVDRVKNPELKEMVEEMMEKHGQEIEQMQEMQKSM